MSESIALESSQYVPAPDRSRSAVSWSGALTARADSVLQAGQFPNHITRSCLLLSAQEELLESPSQHSPPLWGVCRGGRGSLALLTPGCGDALQPFLGAAAPYRAAGCSHYLHQRSLSWGLMLPTELLDVPTICTWLWGCSAAFHWGCCSLQSCWLFPIFAPLQPFLGAAAPYKAAGCSHYLWRWNGQTYRERFSHTCLSLVILA